MRVDRAAAGRVAVAVAVAEYVPRKQTPLYGYRARRKLYAGTESRNKRTVIAGTDAARDGG